jgi:hypothetical protein
MNGKSKKKEASGQKQPDLEQPLLNKFNESDASGANI